MHLLQRPIIQKICQTLHYHPNGIVDVEYSKFTFVQPGTQWIYLSKNSLYSYETLLNGVQIFETLPTCLVKSMFLQPYSDWLAEFFERLNLRLAIS